MTLPTLDQIEKYLKKHNKDMSEIEIQLKAEELLKNYFVLLQVSTESFESEDNSLRPQN